MKSVRALPLLILIFIFLVSVIWPNVEDEPVASPFLYDEAGRVVDTTPYPPSREHWLGTDREGNDLFYLLVTGAKWTILFAFLVTLFRVILATILGALLKEWFASPWVGGLLQAFTFVPQSLIALIWLAPLLLYELRSAPPLTMTQSILLQMIVFTIVGVPAAGKMISETVRHLDSLDFMESARVLGGSSFHRAKVHVFPHLFPRLIILTGRQLVQVLTLLLHLAIFHLFIGGTVITSGQDHDQFQVYASSTYEWAGLIGSHYHELLLEPYIVFFPVMAYSFLILMINLTVNHLEKINQS
ncbi:peptide ABC transporter permease [Bacillus sp. AFS015802]|uniref:ABC transporter permease subunit n=1 Tax=Bacillus sp. AFS015802 TaxID=2033486 RepID=UPI000BF9AC75|nr:ABC transporter permease subunit [Bacillus sp. AFS015802]PFA63247.1 peptide ABC transporter permease [Bacillus sp. AFS015802]